MSSSAVEFAHWKMFNAMTEMERTRLPLRARLEHVTTSYLRHIFVLLDRPEDLPPGIGLKMSALYTRLTQRGSYRESIRAMSDPEVEYVIHHVRLLYSMLAETTDQETLGMEDEAD